MEINITINDGNKIVILDFKVFLEVYKIMTNYLNSIAFYAC